VVAAWSLGQIRFFQILNLKAYDLHFIVRGQQPTSNIILLTEDQKAMDTYTELRPFWHKHYADAIRVAGEAGAKVIGLDHAFGIPVDQWYPDYDRLLAEAILTSPAPVVYGYVPELNSNKQARQVQINMAAAGLGLGAFPNLTSDPDDFVRSQELVQAPKAGDPTPDRSFALKVIEKYWGADSEFRNGTLTLQGRAIPISPERTIAINYAGPPGTFPRVSLADFEAAAKVGDKELLHEWVNGKIVLIGTDFVDDRFSTPFYTPLDAKSNTAGVEIHANTVRTLLDRSFLLPVPFWVRVFALLLATTITVLIATSLAPGRAVGLILLEVIVILMVTHTLFLSSLILSTSEMLLAMTICVVASVIYRFSTEEKRGNLFRRAVHLFVGKQVATSLDEAEDIALSGKRLEVTILFTDIRGFTTFTERVSEEQGPEVVVQMLNEYMADMVAIIVKYHGSVNKFIGDGILAIFSDDDGAWVPGDHPVRAVRCATEMVTLPGRFQTGAGIHTGLAVVGNVGSADKMEYTVLGDTVNLASRLESLNKEHHTKLLMSGATQSRLGNQVETVYLADAPVRGKALPISLYTVASLVETAAVTA
jgi:adenylate cyclase